MIYPELPSFAFLSAFLVLLPLPWHWQSRNVAIVAMIFWLLLVDIIFGVNAIVWAGNVNNPIPVWCDITTKIVVGASYALPLCALCICKHLEMVSSNRTVSFDSRDRRRRMIFEAVMCLLLPVLFVALSYVVQGHRYDIIENFGCQATIYISVPAILIIYIPPIFFSCVTFAFATLAIKNFIRCRLTFSAHLHNSNSALTTNRYLRLIVMSLLQMVWGTSLTALNLWANASPGLRPWISWENVHSNFSRVALYPMVELPRFFINEVLISWWTMPASSLILFLFFGFGEEAMKDYQKIWAWFRRTILRRTDTEKKIPLSFGKFLAAKLPRPLELVKLTTKSDSSFASPGSPSTLMFTSKSVGISASRLSQPTVTLAASSEGYEHQKSKSEEAREDLEAQYIAAPGYSFSQKAFQPDIAMVIDPSRDSVTPAGSKPSSELDDCSSFTISAFPYYTHSSSLTPPSRSELPPPSDTPPIYSLPPPPRHFASHSRPTSSVMSIMGSTFSNSHPFIPGVPEDVESESYNRPSSVFEDNDRHRSPRTLGVPGGMIMVTVERQSENERSSYSVLPIQSPF